MRILRMGRLRIIIELMPKKDKNAFQKLMDLRNRPMKMTEKEYIKWIETET